MKYFDRIWIFYKCRYLKRNQIKLINKAFVPLLKSETSSELQSSGLVSSSCVPSPSRLPVPWLLYSLLHGLAPVAVSSNGLFCAIVLLFIMLLFVIISIATCEWKMNKVLGSTMFLLYFIFLVLSVMLEDRIITCPVSIWPPQASGVKTTSRGQLTSSLTPILHVRSAAPNVCRNCVYEAYCSLSDLLP